jgi:hypothetical protein
MSIHLNGYVCYNQSINQSINQINQSTYLSTCSSILKLVCKVFLLWLRIRKYGDRSPLGPKQSEASFSDHLNRQHCSGGSELLDRYSPISRDGYPHLQSAESPMVGADVKPPLSCKWSWRTPAEFHLWLKQKKENKHTKRVYM